MNRIPGDRRPARTSVTDPLEIAQVRVAGGGVIGVTFCPGKQQAHATGGPWMRDLGTDLDSIAAWRARVLVTLMPATELAEVNASGIGAAAQARGLRWLHLPIVDVSIPDAAFLRRWPAAAAELHAVLDAGGRIAVHCRGGLGRAGMIATRLLVERGVAGDAALREVRAVRPGAVETWEQEKWAASGLQLPYISSTPIEHA